MNTRIISLLAAIAVAGLSLSGQAQAQSTATRTQTIALKAGWNSVSLQVQPLDTTPSAAFAGIPVGIVATFFAQDRAVEFVTDPNTTQWKKEGWGVWYADNRPDSFLSSLFSINGNRSYLIFAESDCTWTIEGRALLEPVRWKSESYNLVGFCLDTVSPPTFQRFFKGSAAHKTVKAYRLVSNRWTQVSDPSSAQMKDGEAYWIYCQGGSDFQGPLNVKLPLGPTLAFADSTTALDIVLRSDSADPLIVSLQPPGDSVLPLAYLVRAISPGNLDQRAIQMTGTVQMPVLEPFTKSAVQLELRREKMIAAQQAGLLKISTDAGTVQWVTVTGARNDLPAAP